MFIAGPPHYEENWMSIIIVCACFISLPTISSPPPTQNHRPRVEKKIMPEKENPREFAPVKVFRSFPATITDPAEHFDNVFADSKKVIFFSILPVF